MTAYTMNDLDLALFNVLGEPYVKAAGRVKACQSYAQSIFVGDEASRRATGHEIKIVKAALYDLTVYGQFKFAKEEPS